MTDLEQIAGLLATIDRLEADLAAMHRQHFRFITTLCHAFGGELRVTPYDYAQVPPGTTLSVRTDPQSGDVIFKTTTPPCTQEETPA